MNDSIRELIAHMTLEEKAAYISGADFWNTKEIPRLDIPSAMMCDGPHGLRKQSEEQDHLGIHPSIETVCYPSAAALASSFDRTVLSRLGTILGKECQAERVAMLLGPGVNIKRSPLCGRSFEYFSEDPYLSGEMAAAYISALQEQGVAACVKHFALNSQETNRMSSSSDVDERTMHEIYLPAFEVAVKQGHTRSVMCAYNAVNGTYCAENRQLMTDILRSKWGFDGMVVTDWGAVKDRVKGLLAGIDLEMPGGSGTQTEAVLQAVHSGELEESRLDEAVGNILRFVLESSKKQCTDAEFDRAAAAALSQNMAEQCGVLLKNEGLLPLSESQRVLFTGPFADKPRFQGAGSSHIRVTNCISALQAAKQAGLTVDFEANPEQAVKKAAEVDAVVFFGGLPEAWEAEGKDREQLALPEEQNRQIAALSASNPNTIVVLHCGSPVELPWLEKVKAVLCMYLGGQNVGAASVNLLYGRANPSGKLAESWPLRLEDTPAYLNFPDEDGKVSYAERIYVGYRYYDKRKMWVLFPFGYGLSYTQFTYSDLRLSQNHMTDEETLLVCCKIKNIGACAGAEAVQLYVGDIESSVGRPVRELKGFEKVFLAPGEKKTVEFRLSKRAFAWYEPKIKDWYVESGSFRIEIGSSSRDIRLTDTVYVEGLREIPIHYTGLSTVGDLTKTAVGRQILSKLMSGADSQNSYQEEMGEGTQEVMASSVMGMPLQAIVSFGQMTQEQLDEMLNLLNAGEKECFSC